MASGFRVKQAREFRGITQEALAEELGLVQSAIAQIEAELIDPSDHHLTAISFQTGFPISFFREHPEFEFPLPSHLLLRARKSFSARDKKRAHRFAEIAFEAIEQLLPRLSIPPISLPRESEDCVSAAESFRSLVGLSPDGVIQNAVRVAEKAGILIFQMSLPDECDAFSCWVEATERRPVIFCSSSTSGDRQNWSIAHEIGHLVLHERSHSDRNAEREADEFAAELLLPAESFRGSIGGPLTPTSAGFLKRRWFTSMQAIIRRARDLGEIDEKQYKSLMVQISRRGWRKQEPYPIHPSEPILVRGAVERLFGNPIDVERFAREVNLSATLARQIIGIEETSD